MSTSTEQIAALIGSNTALKEFFEGARDDIEAAQAAHGAAVDGFIEGAKDQIWLGSELSFDPAVTFSKTGMALAADVNDPARTVWGEVTPRVAAARVVIKDGGPTVLSIAQAVQSPPGASEDPAYQVDNSVTRLQFILANLNASSDDINLLIADNQIDVPTFGLSMVVSTLARIPVVRKDGISANGRLYVRFVNEVVDSGAVPGGAVPQAIDTYGGNTVFSLNRMTHHPA